MTNLKNRAFNHSFKTYKVQIGGCSLQLKSQQDAGTFKAIMDVVEQQMDNSQHQALSMQKKMALSCLNIAGDLVCLKKQLARRLNRLESAAKYAVSQLKSSPAPPGK